MLEKFLVPGSVIHGMKALTSTVRGEALHEVHIGVQDVAVEVDYTVTTTTRQSIWHGLRHKTIENKTEHKATWYFRLLPYVQGSINYTEMQGRDVLSGWFSGCIMAKYYNEGTCRVCHVSTGAPNDCKDAWNVIKSGQGMHNVSEFRPFDKNDPVILANLTLGLITGNGIFYTIWVNRAPNDPDWAIIVAVMKRETGYGMDH